MGKKNEIASGRRLLNVIRGDGHAAAGAEGESAERIPAREQEQSRKQKLQALKKLNDSIAGEVSPGELSPEAQAKEQGEQGFQPLEALNQDLIKTGAEIPASPAADEEQHAEYVNYNEYEESVRQEQFEPDQSAESYRQPVNVRPYQRRSMSYRLPPQGFLRFGRTYIGLDEGTYAIKMVELEKKGGIYNLLSFALIETLPAEQYENKTFHTNNVLEGIRHAISKTRQGRSRVYTAIGGSKVMVRQLSMPQMSPEELESSIKWEAKKYMPYNPEEMELDYRILSGNPQTTKMDVLLAAAPSKQIKRKLDIMQQLNIRSAATDVNPLAVINAFIFSGEYKAGERVIILDIGSEVSYLNIYRADGEYFVRNIPTAGEQFTREIMHKLQLDYLSAESIKRESDEILSLLAAPLRAMVLEIRRTLTFYRNQLGVKGFDRMLVTGGGACLKGLADYLCSELEIEVSTFNPLRLLRVNDPEAVKILKPFASQLTTAIGLVVRG